MNVNYRTETEIL